ncbi:glycosyl hydrolase family 30 [Bifidobacterium callimiconis]|uniref:glycoside hydrolase family 30 protein n=1 Tax=Bifidobacterium callimiconis TaxID=2306973 RepID=UPI001BDC94CB|nr:glycoside hydrolase family 30 beta sandwich domain-containing protein [Bifidobacterium callimiconis]MBT1178057.1 glycosyl hydrolase family 30 [Bifidobacterium callimiconis]
MMTSYRTEYWTRTSGDLADRRAPIPTPEATGNDAAANAVKIVIDPTRQYQLWEGAGAAITDSSASLFMQSMSPEQRHAILTEMFDPEQGGFSSVRISIGACDFSSQAYYSYDDLPEGVVADAALDYFSIGEGEPGAPDATKDLKNVVPVLQEILSINPAVKVMASPWSAPAWMKTSGRLDGAGRLRLGEYVGNGYRYQDTIDYVYAQYFVKFIAAYESYGIPITSVTMQNEPSNGCPWPITIWTPEELTAWGANYLRPALDKTYPDVEIYFGDDSLRFWQRPASEYMTPAQAQAFAGAAFHTYSGLPHWVHNGTRQFPQWKAAMTERRCMLDETVAEASHVMFGEIGTWLVRNGVGLINLWNMALDEQGFPSWAGTSGRRGVITIDSGTGKVKRNLEYFMLRNYGQNVAVGSRRVASTNHTPDGRHGGLGSVAFLAPNGDLAGFLYNPTGEPIEAAVTVNGDGARWQTVTVPAYGTVSFHKSVEESVNTTQAPADDEFEITYTPHPADDHDETIFE